MSSSSYYPVPYFLHSHVKCIDIHTSCSVPNTDRFSSRQIKQNPFIVSDFSLSYSFFSHRVSAKYIVGNYEYLVFPTNPHRRQIVCIQRRSLPNFTHLLRLSPILLLLLIRLINKVYVSIFLSLRISSLSSLSAHITSSYAQTPHLHFIEFQMAIISKQSSYFTIHNTLSANWCIFTGIQYLLLSPCLSLVVCKTLSF
jgi:hypothetical protein